MSGALEGVPRRRLHPGTGWALRDDAHGRRRSHRGEGGTPRSRRRHPGVGSTLRPRRSVHLLPVGQPQQEVHRLGPHRLRRSGTRPPPRTEGRRTHRELQAGRTAAFRVDYPSVATDNPAVVYCSISGFGSDLGKDLPGYDLLVQAMGGLMSVTGIQEPTKAGVAVVDVLTGLHAAFAVTAALTHRERTGRGQRIEVSLLSSLLSPLVNQSSAYVGAGTVPTLMGNAHPSIAPYEVFATADRPMIIAVGNDGQFTKLVGSSATRRWQMTSATPPTPTACATESP